MRKKKPVSKPKKRLGKKVTVPLLVLSALALSSLTVDYKSYFSDQPPAISFLQDYGSLQLYFCPRENCEDFFIQALDTAQESLHCALFEVELESLKKVLLEKQPQMEVKIVTDNDYLNQFNYPFVQADTWGLMHNKFCIIDGKTITTGSMNPTFNDAYKNNNNLLIINSPLLAQNYEDEFQEMWQGQFKKGSLVRNAILKLNQTLLQNYFCPEDLCAEHVKEELKKAKESIYFMTFSFTHDGIANILLLKQQEGIKISGVMEARQVTEHSVYKVLEYQGMDVRKDGNKQNMHHKVFIIDEKVVVTGSFNPTAGGNERNDENVLIIEDEEIAKRFVEEFWMVYEEGQEIDGNALVEK